MNDSKFKMWRLALSIIHVDGKVDAEEIKWFEEKLKVLKSNKFLNFSKEQIIELEKVLESPTENFFEEFKALTKASDASFLLHLVRTVGHIDGDFCQDEENVYWKLDQLIHQGIDKNSIDQKLKALELKEEQKRLEAQANKRPFEKIIDMLVD